MVIYQTSSDVVLGFIRWACGHPPNDDPDPIAGVTGWALSLHEIKLLRVTDKKWVTATPESENCTLQSYDLKLGLIAVGTTTNELFFVLCAVNDSCSKTCDWPNCVTISNYAFFGNGT